MTSVKATVVGDIPAHRLLWLYGSDDGQDMKIGLPKERGNYVDFVTSVALQDGQEVTINIKNNPVWLVEAATRIDVGANVAANTDGRVGAYTSAPIRIGYSLDYGEAGDLVRIVRSPKVYWHNLDLSNEGQDLSAMTNSELKGLLDEKGIEYASNATKAELIELLEGD